MGKTSVSHEVEEQVAKRGDSKTLGEDLRTDKLSISGVQRAEDVGKHSVPICRCEA